MATNVTARLIHYFKSYPKSEVCFVTSDETIFHNESDANTHAATLKQKTITPYTRKDINTLTTPPAPPVKGESQDASPEQAEQGIQAGSETEPPVTGAKTTTPKTAKKAASPKK